MFVHSLNHSTVCPEGNLTSSGALNYDSRQETP